MDHEDEERDNGGVWDIDVDHTTIKKRGGKSVVIVAKITRK